MDPRLGFRQKHTHIFTLINNTIPFFKLLLYHIFDKVHLFIP